VRLSVPRISSRRWKRAISLRIDLYSRIARALCLSMLALLWCLKSDETLDSRFESNVGDDHLSLDLRADKSSY